MEKIFNRIEIEGKDYFCSQMFERGSWLTYVCNKMFFFFHVEAVIGVHYFIRRLLGQLWGNPFFVQDQIPRGHVFK